MIENNFFNEIIKIFCTITINFYFDTKFNCYKGTINQMKSLFSLIVISIILILKIYYNNALDVSFIPNDENAPLPLSKKYRDSLRKLCILLANNESKLPYELQQKKVVLKKMCKKLSIDDKNIESSQITNILDLSKFNMKTLILSLLSISSGCLIWNHRRWLGLKLRNIFKSKEFISINKIGREVDNNNIYENDNNNNNRMNDVDGIIGIEELNKIRLIEAREARLKKFENMNSGSTATIE